MLNSSFLVILQKKAVPKGTVTKTGTYWILLNLVSLIQIYLSLKSARRDDLPYFLLAFVRLTGSKNV